MTEFWNSDITEASWQGLTGLKKEIDFVVIGGWATYLYSKLQKSQDIDIIIDYPTLRTLESRYLLSKNERLKKYEIKMDNYDIDIYLPNFSALPIPPKDIISDYATKVEGFTLPTPEALLVLKLGAAQDRRKSTKGEKDAIDVLGLLFYSKLKLSVLKAILARYKLAHYADLLVSILRNFDKGDFHYLNLNESGFSKLKRRYLEEIKKAL
ncbi:MAG: hypothetical protein ACREBF_01805 [Candidatus Micrarchaeales archaeon]